MILLEETKPHLSDMLILVDRERDRRIYLGVIFNNIFFQFDDVTRQRIIAMGALASIAISQGSPAGNLRWFNPNNDFAWIAADNTLVPMDAQTMLAFSETAAGHEASHIFAGRFIKNMTPIPLDFEDNKYWPT